MDDLDLGDTIKGYSPGQRVFARYTLKRLLGRGGMGVVWLAHDDELGRESALKFLPEVVAADRAAIEDMKREVRRAIDLAHPHIVKINDFVTDGRTAAVSMEFIAGGTLSALRVDQPGQVFAVEPLVPWVRQLCSALDYAHHDAEIVHRDLKPVNLMIDGKGRLRVLDFGISASLSESVTRISKQAGTSGTPLYMSPQQMMGENPAVSDDLYSVGATLFELLTGKPPFFSGNILLQVQNKAAPRLNERRAAAGLPPVPPEWDETVAACLAKEPGGRPSGAAEIAQRLTGATFAPREPKAAAPKPAATPPVVVAPTAPTAPTAPAVAPAPAAPAAPPRPPIHIPAWVWVGTGVAAVALALWLGDVPNRFLASRQAAAAEAAAGDWTGLLTARREAVRLRPTDLAHRDAYREAQARWLRETELELAGLAPGFAFDRLPTHEPLASLLDETHAARWRELAGRVTKAAEEMVRGGLAAARATAAERDYAGAYGHIDLMRPYAALVGGDFAVVERAVQVEELTHAVEQARAATARNEFAAAYERLEKVKAPTALLADHALTLQSVRESEVRFEVAAALALAGAAKFDDALAALDKTAARNLLGDEVAAARTKVLAAAETHTLERLAAAITAGKAAETTAALADYGRFTGTKVEVAGEQLVAERDLSRFLSTLEALRIRPAAGEARKHWRDLLLVANTRARFSDAAAVKTFLADGYARWSRDLAERGLPALALYLDDSARREGAPTDARWTAAQQAKLAGRADLRLAVEPLTGASREAPRLADEPLKALRGALGQRVGSWLPLVAETERGENTFRLRLAVKGPTSADKPTVERRSSRYQSGTRTVNNNNYDDLVDQVNSARETVNARSQALNQVKAEANRLAQQAGQSGMSAGGALGIALAGGISVAAAQSSYNDAVNELNNLRSQLSRTPRTLQEPVYADEGYDYITHNLTYGAEFTVTPLGPDGRALRAVPLAATRTHRTVEVNGNRSRGVPVQSPQYPSAGEIDKLLASDLAAQAAKVDGVLGTLAAATFDVQARRKFADTDPLGALDRSWALALLWRGSGVTPAAAAPLERDLRNRLGLGSAAAN